MPPRIPRILPEASEGALPPEPSLDPAGLAELSTRGTRAIAGALGVAASEAERIYAVEYRLDKAVQAERLKLETEQALGQYDRQAADAVFRLKGDPNIQPEDYSQRVEQELRKVKDAVGKQIKNAAVLPRFDIGAERKITTDTTKAKYDGYERRIELNKAGMSLLNREDANLAAAAAPGSPERRAALARITERLDRQLAVRALTATEYDAHLGLHLGDIEESDVRRDFRDPAKRQAVIDGLLGYRYRSLSADKQAHLADTLQNQHDAQVAKVEAAAEKAEKKKYTTVVDDLYTRASPLAGTERLTPAQLETELRDRGMTLHRTDREAIEAQMTKDPDEAPSDPLVRARVMSDVLSMNPQMSEQELRTINAQHRGAARTLNSKDYQTALSHRTSRITAIQTRAESREVRDYHQADQLLRTALGIPDIIPDKIDPTRLLALDWARQELQNRSWPTDGRTPAQPALDAIKDIIPRAKQLLGDNATMSMDNIRTLLQASAPDLAQLPDAAKMAMQLRDNQKAGKYSSAQYENIRRLVVDFQRAWTIHYSNQARQFGPVPAAPMAAPPSGTAPPAGGRAAPTGIYTAPVR